jgi:membrane fusion protein, multidrug efflux system
MLSVAKRGKWTLLLAATIVIVGGGWMWFGDARAPSPVERPPPAVPVETALAARGDMPVYLQGLGTVQAFNTVTVTTRVDGQMQSVNFVEGQDIKAGDVLAQIDPRPYQAMLDQAVATKAKDEAQLANARLDLQRYTTLAPQNFASKQTLDTQRALVAQLEAQVKIDQAAIDSAQTNLDYTTIRSPLDGRTGIRLVDAGNNLLSSASTPVVVVTQLRPISVIFTLPEEELSGVSKGMAKSSLTAIALARDNATELDRGAVAVLDNEINQSTGTVRLKATFPNANETLWPGDFVNIHLLVRTEPNVLTIPSPAVQRGPDGLYVYVVKADMTVEIRPISLERFESGKAVITNGLQAGERVVSAGQYRLQAGVRVRPSGAEIADSDRNPAAAEEKAK